MFEIRRQYAALMRTLGIGGDDYNTEGADAAARNYVQEEADTPFDSNDLGGVGKLPKGDNDGNHNDSQSEILRDRRLRLHRLRRQRQRNGGA